MDRPFCGPRGLSWTVDGPFKTPVLAVFYLRGDTWSEGRWIRPRDEKFKHELTSRATTSCFDDDQFVTKHTWLGGLQEAKMARGTTRLAVETAWKVLLVVLLVLVQVASGRRRRFEAVERDEAFLAEFEKLAKCYRYSTNLLSCDMDVEVRMDEEEGGSRLCVQSKDCGSVPSFVVSRANPCECPPSNIDIRDNVLYIQDIKGTCAGDRLATIPGVVVPETLDAAINHTQTTITVPKAQLDICPEEGCVFTEC